MCCCGKPVVNGELGYRWQPNDAPSVRQPNAPQLGDADVLLFDEPGRCGGVDSHSHHYRVVRHYSSLYLLVRHGGGDERINLGSCYPRLAEHLATLDSNGRYWFCNLLHGVYRDGEGDGKIIERERWHNAAIEKRIKTRKQPKRGFVKVWIEPKMAGGAV